MSWSATRRVMLPPVLVLVSLFATLIHAATNDWDIPCFSGNCSYDNPDSSFPASLRISGSPRSVSDITKAGGWTILNCDAHALEQEVRLVCHSSYCTHLFNGFGAVNTLIRLPENCSKSAFARVASIRVDPNQYIPYHISKRIPHGPGRVRTVYFISIDTDFTAGDPSTTENVAFTIDGSRGPAEDNSDLSRRLLPFNTTKTFQLASIDIAKSMAQSGAVSCPDFNATIDANLQANMTADISLGVRVTGWLIWPTITAFDVMLDIDSTFSSKMHLAASASGTFDTGQITLYQLPLGGLDFPGILSVTPNFKLLGQIQADLDFAVDLETSFSYDFKDSIAFPTPQGLSASPSPNRALVNLNVSNSVAATGQIEAHAIPTLSLDVSAFSGIVGASVYIDLDASAVLGMQLNASSTASSGEIADGCGHLDAGISINAGVGAHAGIGLVGLSKADEVTLFTKQWTLFDKCFGGANTTTKRNLAAGDAQLVERNTLTCPPDLKYVMPTVGIADDIITSFS